MEEWKHSEGVGAYSRVAPICMSMMRAHSRGAKSLTKTFFTFWAQNINTNGVQGMRMFWVEKYENLVYIWDVYSEPKGTYTMTFYFQIVYTWMVIRMITEL